MTATGFPPVSALRFDFDAGACLRSIPLVTLLFSALFLASGAGDGLPVATPTSVGMSAARLAKIDHVIERGITAGGYPGASVVVGRRGSAVWEKGFGRLGWSVSVSVLCFISVLLRPSPVGRGGEGRRCGQGEVATAAPAGLARVQCREWWKLGGCGEDTPWPCSFRVFRSRRLRRAAPAAFD